MSVFDWYRDSKGNWVRKEKKKKTKKKPSLGTIVGGGAGKGISKRAKRIRDIAEKTK